MRTIGLADGSSVPGCTAAGLAHAGSQALLPWSEVDGISGWGPERVEEGGWKEEEELRKRGTSRGR